MTIYYCYDAYCGWCYGFSKVMAWFAEDFKGKFFFEVLSGGMIPKESAKHISTTAPYIREAYKQVEELTGVVFGQDYLWHINNPQDSDWYPHSEMPAVAMCVFKEYRPDDQVAFAADLQYALHYEGRDLTDEEAYRHLLVKYDIDADDFYAKLHDESYIEKAHYEFALCRQLQVTGFPQVLLQVSETKFYLLAKGYTTYENLTARLANILQEIGTENLA
ncbi:MAG: DsbA family protein [Niabella sp.]